MIAKKCALILPYFGKFNNYFPLFLKSCKTNKEFDWYIFTDSSEQYDLSNNIKWIKMTLNEFSKLATEKIGLDISLKQPYKLCDFKPTYGLVFEDYIGDYSYWGHCDCDVIFGNLDKIVGPLLEKDYDKIFAAGHLTIYKNTYQNNTRFKSEFNGKKLYKEYLLSEKICWFDEDMYKQENIHGIFLGQKCHVYAKDLSMNTFVESGKFIRCFYDDEKREFLKEKYQKARYFWDDGNIYRLSWNGKNNKIEKEEFAYIHLQSRKMRMFQTEKLLSGNIIQILPDRFSSEKEIPDNRNKLKLASASFTYLYFWDKLCRRTKRKLKNIKKKFQYGEK